MTALIEVNGVVFWGIDKGRVIIEEITKISSPPDSVLHLLRHFSELSEEWIQRAVAEGITTREFIEEQLRLPGSKWNPKIGLDEPELVIGFSRILLRRNLEQGKELRWIGRGKLDLCFLSHSLTQEEKIHFFEEKTKEEPVGMVGLISLLEIPPQIEVRQSTGRGSDLPVNVVEMNPPTTDTVVITLARRENGTIQIWSAFPGILTPPFPKAYQLPEEYEYNKCFWERYALIETKY